MIKIFSSDMIIIEKKKNAELKEKSFELKMTTEVLGNNVVEDNNSQSNFYLATFNRNKLINKEFTFTCLKDTKLRVYAKKNLQSNKKRPIFFIFLISF